MGVSGQDVHQLLLQCDASIALAQRNLASLAGAADQAASGIEGSLQRPEDALARLGMRAKSAADSFSVFEEAQRAADRLYASVNPLFAAQQRYDQELEKFKQATATGAMDANRFAEAQVVLKQRLQEEVAALANVTGHSGNARAAQQELMHIVRASADAYAAGAPPMMILLQHLGMMGQAMSMMGGSGGSAAGAAAAVEGVAGSAAAAGAAMETTAGAAGTAAEAMTAEAAASEQSTAAATANAAAHEAEAAAAASTTVAAEASAAAKTANTAATEANAAAQAVDATATAAGTVAAEASATARAANTVATEANTVAVAENAAAAGTAAAAEGGFASFISGPWGLALIAGVTILGTLAANHAGAAHEAHEHESAEDTLTRALSGQKDAITQVTQALRDLHQAEEQHMRSETERIEQGWARARSEVAVAQGIRTRLGAELAAAEQETDRQAQQGRQAEANILARPAGPQRDEALAAQRAANAQTLLNQGGELTRINALISSNQGAMIEAQQLQAQFATEMAHQMSTATGRVNTSFDDQARALRQQYTARYGAVAPGAEHDGERAQVFRDEEAAYHRLEIAHGRATAAAEAETRSEEGRAHQARERDLVRPAAGSVISQFGADRSGVPLNGRLVAGRRHEGVDIGGALGDPVVAPEGGVARVLNAPGGLGLYVEIRADSGARDLLGHLSAANIRSGDRVAAGDIVGLIGNSGNARGGPTHLHWQRQVNGQWVDPMRNVGSSGAASEAARAAHQVTEQQASFDRQKEQLETQILQAQGQLSQSIDDQTESAKQIAIQEGDRRNAGYHDQVTRHQITETQAKELTARSDALTFFQLQAVDQRHAHEIAQQQAALQQATLDSERELLQGRLQLATTNEERLALERQMLEVEKQRERAQLTSTLDFNSGASADDRARALIQYNTLDQRYALRGQALNRQYEDPGQRYMRELQERVGGPDGLNSSLRQVEVDGLTKLDDTLAAAAAHALGLKGALGDVVEELIKIGLEREVILPIANALFGNGQGGGGGIMSLLSMLGVGGSTGSGAFSAGSAIAAQMGALHGFDDGGIFDVGGTPGVDQNVLSINGKARARVSASEKIAVIPRVPRPPSMAIPRGVAGAAGRMHVVVELPSSGDMDARIASVSGPVSVEIVRAAAPGLTDNAVAATVKHLNRRPIP